MASKLHRTPDDDGEESRERTRPRPEVARRPEPSLSLDRTFDVLGNERRRAILRYLHDRNGPVDVGAVAEHVAALENDKPAELLRSPERKRVYVALYQFHLPKMADCAVIEFAKNRGRIAPGPEFEQVLPYLDVQPPAQDDWPYCYLLSGVGLLAVTALAGLTGSVAMASAAAVAGMLLLSLYSVADWLEHVVRPRQSRAGGR